MEKGAGSSEKLGNRARSKGNYQEEKIKKEQRAKIDEKGAVKIGKKEREQGEQGKMSKRAESIDPPITELYWSDSLVAYVK